jgi:hypothetical protein
LAPGERADRSPRAKSPEVEIAGDEVRIGEAGNLAVLKKDEWNLLVDMIRSGRLTKV